MTHPIIANRWKTIYNRLMARARHRGKIEGYLEQHHIEPKSVGGTNTKANLVYLTAREHLIAHKLWYRMEFDLLRKKKAAAALWAMVALKNTTSTAQRIIPSSHDFEFARKALTESKKNIPRTKAVKDKISQSLVAYFKENGCHNKGRSYEHLSGEERSRIFGAGNLGRVQSQQEKDKRASSNRKPRSLEAIENIRAGALKREQAKREKRNAGKRTS